MKKKILCTMMSMVMVASLDVYKRQLRRCRSRKDGAHPGAYPQHRYTAWSVSYTHLSLRLFANGLSGTVIMALVYGLLRFIAIAWPSVLHVYLSLIHI